MTRWWLSNAANSVQMGRGASQMLQIACKWQRFGAVKLGGPYHWGEGRRGDPGTRLIYSYIYILCVCMYVCIYTMSMYVYILCICMYVCMNVL